MKNIDGQLIQWAEMKIKKEFKDDVAILAGQLGACKVPSDEQNVALDFFVPATNKGYQLSKTFVIEDMGYDLFPISWERLHNIADLNEKITFALVKAVVLYARTEEDRQKFLRIQQKAIDHLNDRAYSYQKSLEQIDVAMEIYKTMSFDYDMCHVRKAAGGIIQYLSMAIATYNKTYLGATYGKMDCLQEVENYEEKPAEFLDTAKKAVFTMNIKDIKSCCYELIQMTRDFFLARKPITKEEKHEVHYEDLADWYYEARYSFRRLAYYCEEQNVMASYEIGCYLQIEFDAIQDEFDLEDMNLLGSFDSANLSNLKAQGEKLEEYILNVLHIHLKEVQKYAAGKTLYIPIMEEKQKWGSGSGARAYYEERNRIIRDSYAKNATMEELSDEFGLSIESIRKIVYHK